jgi:hypothetical protein
VAFPRCDKRLRGGGDPVWWGSQTSTGATLESVWKWRAPSTTRVRARACCRWRRCGFAWPIGCRPTRKTNPIRSKVEAPLARSRPRALTTPAPSRAGFGGGARSRPVRPGAGIPRQSCDIVRTGPFVATTRPSADAFRMHARHAARNRIAGAGFCRARASLVTQANSTRAALEQVLLGWNHQAANSVCSPPPCGEGIRVGVVVILRGSSSSMSSNIRERNASLAVPLVRT